MLNGMAPAQRHGDVSGAKDMCVSSYTLARSLGDLPSQIDALRAMDLVLIRSGPCWFAIVKFVRGRAHYHCMCAVVPFVCETQHAATVCIRIVRVCCMPRLLGAQTRTVTSAGTSFSSCG